VVTYEVPG